MTPETSVPIAIVGLRFGAHIVRELCESPGELPVRAAGLCDLD